MTEKAIAAGDECVCINDDWDSNGVEVEVDGWEPNSRVPMLNERLTVKEVIGQDRTPIPITGGVGLTFVELGHDDVYSATHFAYLPPDPSDPDNLDFESEYDG